jgi:hypothetical protein
MGVVQYIIIYILLYNNIPEENLVNSKPHYTKSSADSLAHRHGIRETRNRQGERGAAGAHSGAVRS